MRIVIEVDGEKITAVGPDAPAAAEAAAAAYGDPLPGPASAELLQRAKKLGAMSAGPARFGRGAALASSTTVGIEPATLGESPERKTARRGRPRARKRVRRSR